MELLKVSASRRSESGKGAARRLRRDGHVPAVLYGRAGEAQSVVVSPQDLHRIFASERGRNTVIQLELDDGIRETALLASYQHHPVTRAVLHADFLRIALDQPVDVDVRLVAAGKAKGVTKGGALRLVFHKLPVRCLASQIPISLEHDVSELDLDQAVSVADLSLPAGVAVRLRPTRTVLAVVAEKKAAEEETPAEQEGAVAPAPAAASGSEPAAPAAVPSA